ncbi:hydroxymethylglutaryl-CoA synthase family protein [Anthocerotibacter panamensis]|uniref:hydroxymethylglutaryl-CoA synthase family protein n=1 Tax=Anthocerotibacter panamensis TaxID=2857077 RepID=UPI001C4071BE|nr:hydroxymethylglutaryl-CoA synthase [Anthocerotibacter panamensis]
MKIGIEKINLYAGRLCTDAVHLAQARGKAPDHAREQVMVETRSVMPVWEDAVTLAVNAAQRILTPEDLRDIELLIVGTESAVDFSKPISTWVHRLCQLPVNCRNFEVKHACYSGTAALKMALMWVAAGVRPGKKALVISSDYSRMDLEEGFDFIGGGCAVAMLVSADPQILAIDLAEAGYWTHEIADTFRPTSTVERADNQTSLYSYLDALEGAFEHFEKILGAVDYLKDFKKHIYHAPFPGMALQAHRTLLSRLEVTGKAAVRDSFDQKVVESIYFAKQIGTAYGASNFVSLLGLLQRASDLQAGDYISIFAYGSGCQGEFYRAQIGPGAKDYVQRLDLDRHLHERYPLSLEQYETLERERWTFIDKPDYIPRHEGLAWAYDKLYRNQGLLVLKGVEQYHRTYDWS